MSRGLGILCDQLKDENQRLRERIAELETQDGIKFTYDVYFPGEEEAGLFSFSDVVTIIVESGDPGGEEKGEDSFQEFMLQALSEWYDGASVTEREIRDAT